MTTPTPLSEATAGALGSALANTIVFPLDVAKTRLQVQNKLIGHQHDSARELIRFIISKEGIRGLYVGLGSGLASSVFSSFSYFYIYSTVRGRYTRNSGKSIAIGAELLLGAISGALSQLIVLPLGIVGTRQQTGTKSSFLTTMKSIIKDEGITGLWKGLNASLVLCSNPAITYGVFERLKTLVLQRSGLKTLTSVQIFLIGMFSKTLATIVTYPYIMAKIRMQWKPTKDSLKDLSEEEKKLIDYKSAWDILAKIYVTDGFLGWYQVMNNLN
jgi:Mitochondrial carrier protein